MLGVWIILFSELMQNFRQFFYSKIPGRLSILKPFIIFPVVCPDHPQYNFQINQQRHFRLHLLSHVESSFDNCQELLLIV
jgi:hypothetical protein